MGSSPFWLKPSPSSSPRRTSYSLWAGELDVLTMSFLDSLVPFGKSAHLYPHLLAAHVPDQPRRFKKDLWRYQTQFNEHMHQDLKDAGHRLSNGHHGPAEEVCIKSYVRMVKGVEKSVKSHTRVINTKSEVEQLMEISTAKKALRDNCLSAGEKAMEFQKSIRKEQTRKAADDLKIERDLDKFEKCRISNFK
jgi:hypothetical protein